MRLWGTAALALLAVGAAVSLAPRLLPGQDAAGDAMAAGCLGLTALVAGAKLHPEGVRHEAIAGETSACVRYRACSSISRFADRNVRWSGIFVR